MILNEANPKAVVVRTHSDGSRVRRRWKELAKIPEAGMATAEYAIATLAAAGFAGLLYVILKSDQVRGFLVNIINQALSVG